MTATIVFPDAPDVSGEDYCAFGLATCFVRDDSEVRAVEIVEPIPSAQLETLFTGIATSYSQVWGKPLAEFFTADALQVPDGFPDGVQLGVDFVARAIAAARTYQRRPSAIALLPLGTQRDDLNYSTEKKRLLNGERVVRTEDDVKQHDYTHQVL
ncbi:MAG: hypothetical protein HC838_03240 [Spirulinaceae cyanobacterium RM2_2_10]|nr:hypothetical protein [Spirulinaceae cyanobacterium SM2_1_0]NJO19270.1 hypothetical protein [Spirulinaceae cyanobacterium RM2_2_10]